MLWKRQIFDYFLLLKGFETVHFKDSVIGVVICSLAQREKVMPEEQKEGIFPEKFFILEKFFDDLKGNFGNFDLFDLVQNLTFQKMF